MNRYEGRPELLEQFVQEKAAGEQRVTVQELLYRFGLTRYQSNTVSGFLRCLKCRTFSQSPYVVMQIEQAAPAEQVFPRNHAILSDAGAPAAPAGRPFP